MSRIQQKIHTGCSCKRCSIGKDKKTRRQFHRSLRNKQKQEIKKFGEIINVDISIGYTD